MYRFQCDYTEGAHPAIMQRMVETNMEPTDMDWIHTATVQDRRLRICVNVRMQMCISW